MIRIAPGNSQRPVQPVIGGSRPAFLYIFPTSDGITNALTGEINIQMTSPSTPPRPSPVCCFISSWVLNTQYQPYRPRVTMYSRIPKPTPRRCPRGPVLADVVTGGQTSRVLVPTSRAAPVRADRSPTGTSATGLPGGPRPRESLCRRGSHVRFG